MRLYRTLFVVALTAGALLLGACDTATDTPEIVAGPTGGVTGISYEFTAVAPGENPSELQFDWGDGDTSAWTAAVAGGDSATLAHAWDSVGTYDVRARARSEDGKLTDWSEARRLTIIVTWAAVVGGSGYDCVLSVCPTADSGCVVAGYTESYGAGNQDIWLIKTDGDGDTVWTRTYGTAYNEFTSSVTQAGDGGFFIAGQTLSGGTNPEVYVFKTDASGNVGWQRTFGGAGRDVAFGADATSDGGCVVVGLTASHGAGAYDAWLIKLDADGDSAWTRTYGGADDDYCYGVKQTPDGGYILAGRTESSGAGGFDAWLIKTDASGDTSWTRTYGGTADDYGNSVWRTTDGGYIVAGATKSYGAGGYDCFLVKTGPSGDTAWTRSYGGGTYDWADCGRPAADGGYIIVGTTDAHGAGSDDVYIIKTEANGDTAWTRTIGGTAGDYGYYIAPAADGGYFVAGETQSFGAGESDAYIIKTGADGRIGN